MYRIVRREQFGPGTFLWEVEAPDVAAACQPGHFLMVRVDATGERIPLTVADFDRARGTVTVVVQAVGKTTHQMMALAAGEAVLDFIGPLGVASDLRQRRKVVFVGGGLGVAPIYPLLRRQQELGTTTLAVLGFRSRELMFWERRFAKHADELRVVTNDGSYGQRGLVTDALGALITSHPDIDEVIAIGPLPMMRACAELTRPHGIHTVVSLNAIMVDGTGMCGSCRVTVDGEIRFACVDGPDFDAHAVNFEELMLRQKRFAAEEQEAMQRYGQERERLQQLGQGGVDPAQVPSRTRRAPCLMAASQGAPVSQQEAAIASSARPQGEAKRVGPKTLRNIPPTRTPMPEQLPGVRVTNFEEVASGYTPALAAIEADRCLYCKKPRCVPACPVEIDIPRFIHATSLGDLQGAYRVLKEASALPAVCGRVCPQEMQCEAHCVIGKKLEPVAIGRLERFVADHAAGRGWDDISVARATGKRAAIVGAGPAGLSCAGDLAKAGVEVTVYEALHVAGGVLKYGIPEFRLPNDIIDVEVDNLRALGVKFELDHVIGRVFTIAQLLEEKGFDAVFVGTGAGSPKFMGIEGEAFNGVVSANEFLTRVNLMQGFRQPLYDTPVGMGERVAVVGAGNTAMDAARVAVRMGAERVYLVYRRSKAESPARVEELEHAIAEGVECRFLTQPTRILGNAGGWVTGMEVITMELGEPDETGRRRPVAQAGTEHVLDVDMVICALGTRTNPVIAGSTSGLRVNAAGYMEVDEQQMTSIPGLFAGGDIVTGSATVILAMGAGRKAAQGMLRHMGLSNGGSAAATMT